MPPSLTKEAQMLKEILRTRRTGCEAYFILTQRKMLRSVLQREMCDIRRNDLRPNLSPTFATLSPVVINEEIGHTT